MNLKVLRPQDLERVQELEKKLLENKEMDEFERETYSWTSAWRTESLEHYLPLGWSFGAWEGEEGESPLLGYFIAQPILFFRSMTQTLWLENISANRIEVGQALLDLAYRLCREKHLQHLAFENFQMIESFLDGKKVENSSQGLNFIKTAKLNS